MNKYRIVHRKHFSPTGVVDKEYYMVQEEKLKYPWGRLKWCTVKDQKVEYDGVYRQTLSFVFKKDAESYIEKLKRDAPMDMWIDEVVA